MFAGELAAGAGAAVDGFGRIGEIGRGTIIVRAAAFALAEEQGVVGSFEEGDELLFDDHAARVFNGGGVGRLRIRECLVDLHGARRGRVREWVLI
jgi:hypothetical protein